MKKGVSKTVIFMIVVIVGAIILFMGTTDWYERAEESFDKETCRASVVMKSLSKTAGSPWLDLKCSTEKKEFDQDNKEEIIKTLAQDMKTCWYQYGSGKIDFTSNWDWGPYHDYCFACSVFNFKEEGEFLNWEEFHPYIQEYLNDGVFTGGLEINPHDPIYIIFAIKKQYASKWTVWGTIRGIFTLGSYKSGHTPYLVVGNKNKIENQCDGLYIDSKNVEKKER